MTCFGRRFQSAIVSASWTSSVRRRVAIDQPTIHRLAREVGASRTPPARRCATRTAGGKRQGCAKNSATAEGHEREASGPTVVHATLAQIPKVEQSIAAALASSRILSCPRPDGTAESTAAHNGSGVDTMPDPEKLTSL